MINRSNVIKNVRFLLKTPTVKIPLEETETVSKAREILADTASPYRWSDTSLLAYLNDGIYELKKRRPDVDALGYATQLYSAPLVNYIVYRALALDNDAQNNNGALSDKFFALFVNGAAEVVFDFSDDTLGEYCDDAVKMIIALRPDLRIDNNGALIDDVFTNGGYLLPERFADAIAFYAARQGALHSANSMAELFDAQFKNQIGTV